MCCGVGADPIQGACRSTTATKTQAKAFHYARWMICDAVTKHYRAKRKQIDGNEMRRNELISKL